MVRFMPQSERPMRTMGIVLALLLAYSAPALAQSDRFGPKDVATPRALALALHRWASTPPGKTLDINDLFYLMDRDLVAILLDTSKDGRPDWRLLREWFKGSAPISAEGWLETVTTMRVECMDRGANVWARHEVRHTPHGPVIRHCTTDLQLYYDGKRWCGLGWLDVPIRQEH